MSSNRPLPAEPLRTLLGRRHASTSSPTRARRARGSNVIANERVGPRVSHTGSGFSWIDNSQLADGDALAAGPRRRTARASSSTSATPRTARSGRCRPLPCGRPASASPAGTASATRPSRRRSTGSRRAGRSSATTTRRSSSGRSSCTTRPGRAAAARAHRLSRVVLRRRARAAARVRPALPRDAARRRAARGLRAEPHVGRLLRAVRALEHELPVRQRVRRERGRSSGMQGDKAAFLGRFGDLARAGGARASAAWTPLFGRHEDPVAALRCAIDLPAGGSRTLGFALATAETEEAAAGLARPVPRRGGDGRVARARARGLAAAPRRRTAWRRPTPRSTRSPTTGCATRRSPRGSGARCGYYQQSGAFGFRDQLQDSQVWLTIDPERCRAPDPAPRGAPVRRRLGLPLVASADRAGPRHEDDGRPAVARVRRGELHPRDGRRLGPATTRRRSSTRRRRRPCRTTSLRAFRRVFQRTSPRGIPLIGGRRLERRPLGDGPAGEGRVVLARPVPRRAARRLDRDLEARAGARTSRPSSATGAPRSSPRSTRTAGTGSGTCAARSTTAARSGPRATAWAGSS